MRRHFLPASRRAAGRFSVVVVLPAPPFWIAMEMIFTSGRSYHAIKVTTGLVPDAMGDFLTQFPPAQIPVFEMNAAKSAGQTRFVRRIAHGGPGHCDLPGRRAVLFNNRAMHGEGDRLAILV